MTTGFYAYTGTGCDVDSDAAWEYIRDGYLLGPRTVLKGWTKSPRSVLPDFPVDLNKIPFLVQQTLEAAIGNVTNLRRAVMFSGGFDSMLIASLAQQAKAQVAAVTIQFDDFNPLTVAGAIECADKLGIDLHIIHVKVSEFLSAFEALSGVTDEPLLDLDLGVVYAAFKKYEPATAGDFFISGMGADQWFGDIALEQSPGGLAARLDWAMLDEHAHQQVAQTHGYRFFAPFLSLPMLALAQYVPDDMKRDKNLLRALAMAKTIPHRGSRNEEQIPPFVRRIFIKTYGDRAWPSGVSCPSGHDFRESQLLRQIILGLWLEKAKDRIIKV